MSSLKLGISAIYIQINSFAMMYIGNINSGIVFGLFGLIFFTASLNKKEVEK